MHLNKLRGWPTLPLNALDEFKMLLTHFLSNNKEVFGGTVLKVIVAIGTPLFVLSPEAVPEAGTPIILTAV
jgi:hypothetical protein